MSSTPQNANALKAQGSRQTVSSELTPRVFPPLTVCQSRPHCLRRIDYRSDCDWTGVPLFSLWVMAESGAARYFESVRNRSPPFIAFLLVGRSWRTAAHAYAHHNHKEEVLGEWVFTFQGTFPFSPHKENGMRVFASHPIARGNGLNIRCQKVFLTFFSDATYGNLLH